MNEQNRTVLDGARVRKILRQVELIRSAILAHLSCSIELEKAIHSAGKAAYVHLQRETSRVFPDDPITIQVRAAENHR